MRAPLEISLIYLSISLSLVAALPFGLRSLGDDSNKTVDSSEQIMTTAQNLY